MTPLAITRRPTPPQIRQNVDDLIRSAADCAGDILTFYGARLARWAKPDRGRSTCPLCAAEGFCVSYKDGRLFCHYACGSLDLIDLIKQKDGLDFKGAVSQLAAIRGQDDPFERPSGKPRPVLAPRPPVPAKAAPTENAPDASALWSELAPWDEIGKRYADSRGFGMIPGDVVRFVAGRTCFWWLNRAASVGFRLAFAVRDARGNVRNISLRHCGDGAPWGEDREIKKKLVLPRCTVRGVAIVKPTIALLSTNDTEFIGDQVALCEGGTDWLALTEGFDADAANGAPSIWCIGLVGAGNVESVISAFAPVLKGRVVKICFDRDEAGEKASAAAIPLLWQAGAKRVTRNRPPAKDWAQLLEASA